LQNAYNKYGADNFEFDVIELVEIDNLYSREIYYIEKFNSVDNGYNIEYGGHYNKKMNLETIEKISKANSGSNNPNAIIDDEKASDILNELLSLEKTIEEISTMFDVSVNVVYNLQQNRSYKHLLVEHRTTIKARAKLIAKMRLEKALTEAVNGLSQNKASKKYGVSRNTLRKALKEAS
jgi:group I intron endonuclease